MVELRIDFDEEVPLDNVVTLVDAIREVVGLVVDHAQFSISVTHSGTEVDLLTSE